MLAAFGVLVSSSSAAPGPRTSVINGLEAAPGSFPYMAFVVFSNEAETDLCSGTVVSSNVVLTAAHCVLNETFTTLHNPSNFTVVTGNVDWASGEKTVSTVSRVAVSPTFAYLVPSYTPVRGDAAVLQLSTPVSAPPIKLATSQTWGPGTEAVMAGWGLTSAGGEIPETLHFGEAVVQTTEYCGSKFSYFDSSSTLCVLDYPEYRYAACHGDSGGPLLMIAPGTTSEPLEIGIASFGGASCPTNAPQYYTRADSVASWISQKVSEWAPPPPAPAPAPAPAPTLKPTLPRLTGGWARTYTKRSLEQHLGAQFRGHRAYRTSCSAVNATKQKCSVSWWVGKRDYWGHVTIYYVFEGGKVVWNDRYTIKMVNNYCYYYSGHRASCPIKTFRR
jgi:secreted trypsin-like serine protease